MTTGTELTNYSFRDSIPSANRIEEMKKFVIAAVLTVVLIISTLSVQTFAVHKPVAEITNPQWQPHLGCVTQIGG
jgi:hypothetical protein